MSYFRSVLRPKLMLNFTNLERSGPNSASAWTNNNAESMHHVMKIDANWKPHNTPELIKLLSDMVRLQMIDLQRSLYGLIGNFRLIGPFRKFAIREDIFRQKSEEDKR